jgi:hypothetical protein
VEAHFALRLLPAVRGPPAAKFVTPAAGLHGVPFHHPDERLQPGSKANCSKHAFMLASGLHLISVMGIAINVICFRKALLSFEESTPQA